VYRAHHDPALEIHQPGNTAWNFKAIAIDCSSLRTDRAQLRVSLFSGAFETAIKKLSLVQYRNDPLAKREFKMNLYIRNRYGRKFLPSRATRRSPLLFTSLLTAFVFVFLISVAADKPALTSTARSGIDRLEGC